MPPIYLEAEDLAALVEPEWLLAATDDDRNDIADAAVVEQALLAAEAELEAWLRARYALPLALPIAAPLRQAGLALAIEMLAARATALPLNDVMALRIRQARGLLDALARGDLALPGQMALPRADATTRGTVPPVRGGAVDQF